MGFLILAFLSGIIALAVYFSKSKNPMSTVFNGTKPAVEEISLTPIITAVPTIVDPYTQKGQELLGDLTKIKQDCDKVKIEDARLIPPSFYVETQVID